MLCGCVVFGEMWLCVICIIMDFIVLVWVVGIWGQHKSHISPVVCWMKLGCMNLWGSLDLMCDLRCALMCCVVLCLDIFGVLCCVCSHCAVECVDLE